MAEETKEDALATKDKKTDIVKPTKDADFMTEYKHLTVPQEEDFYNVWDSRTRTNRKEPSARVLRSWANRERINTKIVNIIHDPEFVQVTAKGWIGEESKPIRQTDAVVTINYRDYAIQQVFDTLRKAEKAGKGVPDIIEGKDGMPEYKDPKMKLEWYSYINRKKIFGDREAYTKAESILFKKLLGLEWRDKEEIEAEAEDVKIVQDAIKEDHKDDGPTCIDCSTTMKKSNYERKDGKLWYCPKCKSAM
jgi:hypothetical protein